MHKSYFSASLTISVVLLLFGCDVSENSSDPSAEQASKYSEALRAMNDATLRSCKAEEDSYTPSGCIAISMGGILPLLPSEGGSQTISIKLTQDMEKLRAYFKWDLGCLSDYTQGQLEQMSTLVNVKKPLRHSLIKYAQNGNSSNEPVFLTITKDHICDGQSGNTL